MKKKKISALLFTDLHLNSLNINTCLNFISKIYDFVNKNKIKLIIFCGDFIDTRKSLNQDELLTISLIFQKLENLKKLIPELKIIFFPGNHDKLFPEKRESYLDIFQNYVILDKEITYHNIYNLEFCTLPYFEGQIFKDQLEKLKNIELKTENSILFGHCMYEQIPNEIRSKFSKIFLGHNHEMSDFPKGKYLGSCFQQNFSEDNQKGFTILYEDLSTEQIQFCEKEYVLQKVDVNFFNENEIKKFIIDFENKYYPNKVLKIELNGYNKDVSDLKEFCKLHNTVFYSKVNNNIEQQKEEILNISEFSKNQILKYFENFCNEYDIDKNCKDKIEKLILESN